MSNLSVAFLFYELGIAYAWGWCEALTARDRQETVCSATRATLSQQIQSLIWWVVMRCEYLQSALLG